MHYHTVLNDIAFVTIIACWFVLAVLFSLGISP